MTKSEILKMVDHTFLQQTAKWDDIKQLCDAGLENNTASVCIPPSYVKRAKAYVKDNLAICTVIGFPNGYMTTEAKIFETKNALENGADEIDMVINIGNLKDCKYEEIENEIYKIKQVCNTKILKVIIETCLLSNDEKIKMCEIVTSAGADFIKTSTGFSTSGATMEDILLLKKNIGENVKVKAAGGIGSFEDAVNFIDAGADRLGTSRLITSKKVDSQCY